MNNNKIKHIEALNECMAPLRNNDQTIVYCHGIFDSLHIGHIRHLEQARRMGDTLIVTVTPDRYLEIPASYNEIIRAEAVASLNCVDYVAINKWPNAAEVLKLLKPNLYVHGPIALERPANADGVLKDEERIAAELGVRIAFTEEIAFDSSNHINRYLSSLPEEIQKYINVFRQRYSQQDLLSILDNMQDLNVLVVGDTILDEYQYCEAIGKSSKDPVLALKYQSHDLFAGGVLAVANHVANFAKSVQLLTTIGEQNSYEDYIRSQLRENISPYFVVQRNAPTLIKRRFIESYTLNKLFEVYVMDSSGLPSDIDIDVCSWLERHLAEYDVVISADFGHGTISGKMVDTLVNHSPFLTVNTQANAGNRGFHTISRYPRADYVCIAEHEIRLETRTSDGDLKPLIHAVAEKQGCRYFVVTRGRKGALVRNNRGGIISVPAFASNIIDRVGAGDAFFSVTSLAAVQNIPDEMLCFIGNIVGALAVEVIGNKKSIDRDNIQKHIEALMK